MTLGHMTAAILVIMMTAGGAATTITVVAVMTVIGTTTGTVTAIATVAMDATMTADATMREGIEVFESSEKATLPFTGPTCTAAVNFVNILSAKRGQITQVLTYGCVFTFNAVWGCNHILSGVNMNMLCHSGLDSVLTEPDVLLDNRSENLCL